MVSNRTSNLQSNKQADILQLPQSTGNPQWHTSSILSMYDCHGTDGRWLNSSYKDVVREHLHYLQSLCKPHNPYILSKDQSIHSLPTGVLCFKGEGCHLWPWTTKPVLSRWGIFVPIAKNTLYGSKLLIMQKIIRVLSKDHVPWRYFVNFLL